MVGKFSCSMWTHPNAILCVHHGADLVDRRLIPVIVTSYNLEANQTHILAVETHLPCVGLQEVRHHWQT